MSLSTWNSETISILFYIVVQLLSRVQPFMTPWTAVRWASLSFTISWRLLKLMSYSSTFLPLY